MQEEVAVQLLRQSDWATTAKYPYLTDHVGEASCLQQQSRKAVLRGRKKLRMM